MSSTLTWLARAEIRLFGMIIEATDDSVLLVSLATAVPGFSAIQRVLAGAAVRSNAAPRWRSPDDAARRVRSLPRGARICECCVATDIAQLASTSIGAHLARYRRPLARSAALARRCCSSASARPNADLPAQPQPGNSWKRTTASSAPRSRCASSARRRTSRGGCGATRATSRGCCLIRGALLLVALIACPQPARPPARGLLGVLGLADDALVVLVGAAICTI